MKKLKKEEKIITTDKDKIHKPHNSNMNKAPKEQDRYLIEVNKSQLRILSSMCESMSRIICGQLITTFSMICENAWENLHKEDKSHRDNWISMSNEVEKHCDELRKLCWGQDRGSLNGIHYNKISDILWDLYQVFRHQLWLDEPEDKKSYMTVDSDEPLNTGTEPLAKITLISDNTDSKK